MLRPEDLVALAPDIEPIVRLIEETPADSVFAAVADQIRAGLSYRSLMAALFLAGIRNIDPDNAGGTMHAVFVIHSAHQMSLDAAPDEQIIPLFFALWYFKRLQRNRDRLRPMRPMAVESWSRTETDQRLAQAMDEFDPEAAEELVPSLIAHFSPQEIAERLFEFGSRDFRAIGHKAIYAANGWRTLQTIGWRHAEPTLRSLLRSLVAYGPNGRITGFAMDDQCYADNKARVDGADTLPTDWWRPDSEPGFVRELLGAIRGGNHQQSCQLAAEGLVSGKVGAGSIWDAVLVGAAELALRSPAIRPIHGVTSANGLLYAYRQSQSERNRCMMTLQAVGWMAQFFHFTRNSTDVLSDMQVDQLIPGEIADRPETVIAKIFDELGGNWQQAAADALAFAKRFGDHAGFYQVARRLVFAKGDESHRYKFAAAAWEDVHLVSPAWRPIYFAATTSYLCGTALPDARIVEQTRAVLG
jgi:hypothetical protein